MLSKGIFKLPQSQAHPPGAVGLKRTPGCGRRGPWRRHPRARPPSSGTGEGARDRGGARLWPRPRPGPREALSATPQPPTRRRHHGTKNRRETPGLTDDGSGAKQTRNSRSLRPACVPTSSRTYASSRTGTGSRKLLVAPACGAEGSGVGRPRGTVGAARVRGSGRDVSRGAGRGACSSARARAGLRRAFDVPWRHTGRRTVAGLRMRACSPDSSFHVDNIPSCRK